MDWLMDWFDWLLLFFDRLTFIYSSQRHKEGVVEIWTTFLWVSGWVDKLIDELINLIDELINLIDELVNLIY